MPKRRHVDADLHRLEAKGLARAKLRSQRLRVARIRRHTLRGSIALFVVFWGVIFGQLVSGNDPALSAKWSRRSATARRHRSNSISVPSAHAPLPTEVEPEPDFEVEQSPTVEEPVESEFEAEPIEEPVPVEVAPEPIEPVVTSSS